MNRTSIYIIVILFLLVTNIATIISVTRINREPEINPEPIIEQAMNARINYIHEQIGFDQDQRRDYMMFNMKFNQQAVLISEEMSLMRNEMIEEMASKDPDTVLLNSITTDFGELHSELKGLTIEYYFNLKSICNESQQENLYFIFRDMLDPDGRIYGMGRGRGGEGRGMRQMGRGRGRRSFE